MNAATEACFAGHFKQFEKGDLAFYQVKGMTMLYHHETLPGDLLDIYVWEDKCTPRRIHCQIEKNNQLMYNTAIDFHAPRRLIIEMNKSKL